MRARGQKTREGAASAVRHRHDHRHRGQTSETQEPFDADKRPGEKCGLGPFATPRPPRKEAPVLYFLFATGSPESLRPRFPDAVRWFGDTLPLEPRPFISRISDDGRWFVVACGAPDPLFRNRARVTARGALAINGPALRLVGNEDRYGDEMLDREFEAAESRGIGHLFHDLAGSYAVGSITEREGMVAFSSQDGMYPVYHAVGEGYCAVSNRATTLAKLTEASPNINALAWLVAAGNVFGPETAFRGVDKVEPGEFVAAPLGTRSLVRQRFSTTIWPDTNQTTIEEDLSPDDWDDVTNTLLKNIHATSDDRRTAKINLGLTGGKDSRLVLALASAAGMSSQLRIFTTGIPSWGDPMIAAEVCRTLGVPHELREPKQVGGQVPTKPWSHLLAHVSRYEGLVSPWDGVGPQVIRGSSVKFDGFGGELFRGSHAAQFKRHLPRTVDGMQHAFIDYHQRFDPAGVLRSEVAYELMSWLFEWVSQTSKYVRLDTLPEKFYVDYRLGHWNGPLAQNVPGQVRISPLLDANCAAKILRLTPDARRVERFHYEVMRRTAPEILHIPFYNDAWSGRLVETPGNTSRSAPHGKTEAAKGWQFDFAETQRENVACLLRRAADRGLAEIVDIGTAVQWTLSADPKRDVVAVKTLLSLAATSLMLLDEGQSARDIVY